MASQKKKIKQQNPVKLFIIGIIMVGLVVGYYFHLSNKTTQAKESSVSLTEVDEVLLRNLSTDYPPSPKEVVKYYAQITKCFYDGQFDEGQLEKLALKSRELFDDELKATQTDEEYLRDLKIDISDYSTKDIRISSYSTSSSVDVDYANTEDGELATLFCLYNIRQGTVLKSSNHMFVLRKDAQGHWKILGWTLATDEEAN